MKWQGGIENECSSRGLDLARSVPNVPYRCRRCHLVSRPRFFLYPGYLWCAPTVCSRSPRRPVPDPSVGRYTLFHWVVLIPRLIGGSRLAPDSTSQMRQNLQTSDDLESVGYTELVVFLRDS